MPELPELEVVCEVLQRRVVGQTIAAVEVSPAGGPIVVRDLTQGNFGQTLTGATFVAVARRGKFLLFSVEPPQAEPLTLVLNPKLTGRLQLAQLGDKRHAKTTSPFRCRAAANFATWIRRRWGSCISRAIWPPCPITPAWGQSR